VLERRGGDEEVTTEALLPSGSALPASAWTWRGLFQTRPSPPHPDDIPPAVKGLAPSWCYGSPPEHESINYSISYLYRVRSSLSQANMNEMKGNSGDEEVCGTKQREHARVAFTLCSFQP
jgi:hypothetical protein